MAALLAVAGGTPPNWPREGPTSIPCPFCQRGQGEVCKDNHGLRRAPHRDRVKAYHLSLRD